MKIDNMTIKDLISIDTRYSRSINIKLEADNSELFELFVPTDNLVRLLSSILNSVNKGKDRAKVMVGPYGSGKSLFASILSQILRSDKSQNDIVIGFLEMLAREYPDYSLPIREFLESNYSLYPLLLYGHGDDLETLFLHAIEDVAERENIKIDSIFSRVSEIIALWERDFPQAYNRFISLSEERYSDYNREIESRNHDFVKHFETLYPQITAGAELDLYKNINVIESLKSLNEGLAKKGYKGIYIIYDEFGLYLNKAVENPRANDFSLLQDIAEYCNKSSIDSQVHLSLITHKTISNYLSGIDDVLLAKWKAIEGRFSFHDMSSQSETLFGLIGNVIRKKEDDYKHFAGDYSEKFDFLLNNPGQVAELFPRKLNEKLIKHCFPLHPVTALLLPYLSLLVGQNERTLFSFLGIEEDNSLLNKVKLFKDGFDLVTAELLYDYFENEIMSDLGPNGKHSWAILTNSTLKSLNIEDELLNKVVKTIALFQIVDLPNFRLEQDIITYSLYDGNMDSERFKKEIGRRIKHLIKLRLITERDRNITLINRSNFNIEAELEQYISSINLKPGRISKILNEMLPRRFFIPKEYNANFTMTRYFPAFFKSAGELKSFLNEERPLFEDKTFLDGMVIFCLPLVNGELELFDEIIESFFDSERMERRQFVFVKPAKSLNIGRLVSELEALKQMLDDKELHRDDSNIKEDIEFYLDNTVEELNNIITDYFSLQNALISHFEMREQRISGAKEFNKLISHICRNVFNRTFHLNIDVFNKNKVSTVQKRALLSVLDIVINNDSYSAEDIGGGGPDDLIFRNAVVANGFSTGSGVVCENEQNIPAFEEIERLFTQFFNDSDFTALIEGLKRPPLGLRQAPLPIFLALFFKDRVHSLTISKDLKNVEFVNSELFIKLVEDYDEYEICSHKVYPELGQLVAEFEDFFSDFIRDEERNLTLKYLRNALIRYYQSIPRLTREAHELKAEARDFLNTIKDVHISDAELFNERLPALIGDKSIREYLSGIREYLDLFFDEIYSSLVQIVSERLNFEIVDLTLADFAEHFRIYLAELSASTKDRGLSDERVIKIVALNEDEQHYSSKALLNRLALILTGIPIQDWSDKSYGDFEKGLEILRIQEESSETVSSQTAEQVELTLSLNGEEIKKSFEDVELSPRSQQLLTMLGNRIERYNKSISLPEKRKLCYELLKRYL